MTICSYGNLERPSLTYTFEVGLERRVTRFGMRSQGELSCVVFPLQSR